MERRRGMINSLMYKFGNPDAVAKRWSYNWDLLIKLFLLLFVITWLCWGEGLLLLFP